MKNIFCFFIAMSALIFSACNTDLNGQQSTCQNSWADKLTYDGKVVGNGLKIYVVPTDDATNNYINGLLVADGPSIAGMCYAATQSCDGCDLKLQFNLCGGIFNYNAYKQISEGYLAMPPLSAAAPSLVGLTVDAVQQYNKNNPPPSPLPDGWSQPYSYINQNGEFSCSVTINSSGLGICDNQVYQLVDRSYTDPAYLSFPLTPQSNTFQNHWSIVMPSVDQLLPTGVVAGSVQYNPNFGTTISYPNASISAVNTSIKDDDTVAIWSPARKWPN